MCKVPDCETISADDGDKNIAYPTATFSFCYYLKAFERNVYAYVKAFSVPKAGGYMIAAVPAVVGY